jgi:iron complex transport system permease protein
VGITVIYIFRWRLNLMAMGDEDAMSMGLNVRRSRLIFMIFGPLIVAAGSSSCGKIMCVDLIVAHMSRIFTCFVGNARLGFLQMKQNNEWRA